MVHCQKSNRQSQIENRQFKGSILDARFWILVNGADLSHFGVLRDLCGYGSYLVSRISYVVCGMSCA